MGICGPFSACLAALPCIQCPEPVGSGARDGNSVDADVKLTRFPVDQRDDLERITGRGMAAANGG
jgi:hypothetical protein